jgi:hypothetical protein
LHEPAAVQARRTAVCGGGRRVLINPSGGGGQLALRPTVLYLQYTDPRRFTMDFVRRMQPKDWMIAAVAFFAGALIF